MIISRGRSYVFVHVPKTGGTSLSVALEARAQSDDILIGDTPKAMRRRNRLKSLAAHGRVWKHSTLRDIDGVLTADDLDGLFVFTLVRNPWDRAVSYYHWLREQGFDHPAVTLSKTLSFDVFLLHPVILNGFRAAPYSSYMQDSTGRDRCDLYVRIEHLDEDAAPLWRHLGFSLNLPHLNRSARRRDYRSYYTPAMVEAIADACREDICKFGYQFE